MGAQTHRAYSDAFFFFNTTICTFSDMTLKKSSVYSKSTLKKKRKNPQTPQICTCLPKTEALS